MLEYLTSCASLKSALPPSSHALSGIGDVCDEMQTMARAVRSAITPDVGDVEVRLEASANAVRHDLLVRLVLIIEGF